MAVVEKDILTMCPTVCANLVKLHFTKYFKFVFRGRNTFTKCFNFNLISLLLYITWHQMTPYIQNKKVWMKKSKFDNWWIMMDGSSHGKTWSILNLMWIQNLEWTSSLGFVFIVYQFEDKDERMRRRARHKRLSIFLSSSSDPLIWLCVMKYLINSCRCCCFSLVSQGWCFSPLCSDGTTVPAGHPHLYHPISPLCLLAFMLSQSIWLRLLTSFLGWILLRLFSQTRCDKVHKHQHLNCGLVLILLYCSTEPA